MASAAIIEQFVTAANGVIGAPIEELIENPKWGTVNFKDVEPELRLAKQFVAMLRDAPLHKLTESMVKNLVQPTIGLSNAIIRIQAFSVAQGDVSSIRSGIVQQIRSSSNALLDNNAQLAGFLNFIEEEPDPDEDAFTHSMDKANHQMSNFKSEMSNLVETMQNNVVESDKALQATKETAGRAGLGVFTKDFDEAATKYNDQAIIWLIATAALTLFTFVAAVTYGYFVTPPTPTLVPNSVTGGSSYATDWFAILQYTTTKVVIIGLLITATLWCGKMFNTSKHHHTINKHRANAISTFQAFVEASNDASIKDAVLLETTRSIFAITPTGYVAGDSGGNDSNTIIEVMKNAATKRE